MTLFLLADLALLLSLSAPAPVRPAGLSALYATFGVVQALDVHSTLRALSHGATREANPLLGGLTRHPPAFLAVKAAAVVGTVLLAEYVWRQGYRRTAVVSLLVLNLLTAGVVLHNYRY